MLLVIISNQQFSPRNHFTHNVFAVHSALRHHILNEQVSICLTASSRRPYFIPVTAGAQQPPCVSGAVPQVIYYKDCMVHTLLYYWCSNVVMQTKDTRNCATKKYLLNQCWLYVGNIKVHWNTIYSMCLLCIWMYRSTRWNKLLKMRQTRMKNIFFLWIKLHLSYWKWDTLFES